MKKKVIDIIPPKSRNRDQKSLKKGKKEDAKVKITVRSRKASKKDAVPTVEKTPLIKPKIITGVLIVLFVLIYFLIPHKATIKVFPETELMVFEDSLTVKEGAEFRFADKVITGYFFEEEKTVSQTFPASGKEEVDQKAEGMVTIYNESSNQGRFVATTRFVSSEGKLFRMPEPAVIPSASNGKPGTVEVRVVADEPGPAYNIGPSTFSIPGLAGTASYTKFYAKSSQPMTGGMSKTVALATEEDLNEAESIVLKKAEEMAESALMNKMQLEDYANEYIFSEKTIQTEIIDSKASLDADTEAESFDYQVTAKSKVLAFKKEELTSFSKDLIGSKIEQNQRFYEPSMEISYKASAVSAEGDELAVSLDVSATVYLDPKMSELEQEIVNRSAFEIETMISDQPGVERVEVDFWPFWANESPSSPDSIKIELKLD